MGKELTVFNVYSILYYILVVNLLLYSLRSRRSQCNLILINLLMI